MGILSFLSAILLAVGLTAIGRQFVTEESRIATTYSQREFVAVSTIGLALLALVSLLTAFAMLNPAQFQTELAISATIGLISGVGLLIAAITQGAQSKSWPLMLLTLAVYCRAYGLTHPNKLPDADRAFFFFMCGTVVFVVFQIVAAHKAHKRAEHEEQKRATAHILQSPLPCNEDPDLWLKHGHHLEPGRPDKR